jgi:hypothetical protein
MAPIDFHDGNPGGGPLCQCPIKVLQRKFGQSVVRPHTERVTDEIGHMNEYHRANSKRSRGRRKKRAGDEVAPWHCFVAKPSRYRCFELSWRRIVHGPQTH